MEKEYNVGDTVWWASCGSKNRAKTCPICFGKYKVTLILGDGEHVVTPCDFCGKSFEGPQGVIHEYEWVADVKQITLDGKEVEERNNTRTVEYRYGHYVLRDGEIFSEKSEAEARVKELIEEHEQELARNLASRKEYGTKSYSWHVGYHRKQLKEAERQVAYHSAKVVSMKVKAKET